MNITKQWAILCLSIVLLPACGSEATVGDASDPSPTISPSPSPSLEVPADWGTYSIEEVGISFRFPPLPGEVTSDVREGDSGVGILYEWVHHVGATASGYSYPFAGGASRTFEEGRECWPTDAWTWADSHEGTRVLIGDRSNCSYLVHELAPRRVFRPDGLEAIIFKADDYHDAAGYGVKHPEDRIAMLAFPDNALHRDDLRAITFYFAASVETTEGEVPVLENLSLDDIRLVLRSVEFFEPAT